VVPPVVFTDSEAVPPTQSVVGLAEVVKVRAATGAGRISKAGVLTIISPDVTKKQIDLPISTC